MEKLRLALSFLFALLLIAAGINHFIHPTVYASFIPDWLPLIATNYITGIVEIGLGAGLIFPASRKVAAIATNLLMVFFLPFHVYDVFRTHPAIGSTLFALIRLPLQFLLIYWAWFLVPRAR
ncbi:DoxX family protein [Pedobacter hartonius]|uniref:Uncharacterized membrane protein n=1 Tax=Pedobacter hartonius TaxID=425514 RepID=A0A1H4HD15_9SPHI|nr:MauE/DoxX family redox-associated membrane protein [Pedobacter hartonius]SEB19491.1 Uncharacterized membrane protein [Pedobacter hartonius]